MVLGRLLLLGRAEGLAAALPKHDWAPDVPLIGAVGAQAGREGCQPRARIVLNGCFRALAPMQKMQLQPQLKTNLESGYPAMTLWPCSCVNLNTNAMAKRSSL
eukprot:scaffold222179_cov52-Prasinocladus_malaysianus.AAC.2